MKYISPRIKSLDKYYKTTTTQKPTHFIEKVFINLPRAKSYRSTNQPTNQPTNKPTKNPTPFTEKMFINLSFV